MSNRPLPEPRPAVPRPRPPHSPDPAAGRLPPSADRDAELSGAIELPRAVELPGHARALLATGEYRGYRALFDAAEALDDPHRRYWTNLTLVETGLAASAAAGPRELPAVFATLLDGALQALAREPREPKLLNYAAIAFYELWSLPAAAALFEAAKRLDPALVEVDRNLAQLAQRRRALRGARPAEQLHRSLPALERRALEIAGHAQPADGLRLSLCMIVRDEQEMLPRCLDAVADAVDELVVVDTGSADRTIEIARSFGAKVLEREWTGSFAQARNAGFDAADGDWLMVLDADEVLVRDDAPRLRELCGRTWREAFYVSETNYTGELELGSVVTHETLRIFRNRPEYRYSGRLHEQIASCLPGYLPERLEATGIRIDHYGYLGAVRDSREKSRRNIELLRLQQAESPETPFLRYNLGSEYAVAGESAAALAEFERAWELLEHDPRRDEYQFAPALASRLVRALRACGRPRDAIARAAEALERFGGFTDLVLEQAHASLVLGEAERARELYRRCIEMGDATGAYTATVGCGSYLPRIALAELHLAAGELDAAIELLEHCAREHPQFVGSVLPYATALLARGDEPQAVLAAVERHVPELSPPARFMLGTALYESGALAAGEQQFRLVLARQPHSARARVALGETLLAQRRYAQAAAVTAEVASADPLAAIASRTELFARILAGDFTRSTSRAHADGSGSGSGDNDGDGDGDEQLANAGEPDASANVERALARAETAGLPPAELALFEGWVALAAGRQCGVELSLDAVPLLETMLDALLRVQELVAFETLLALLDRTPLDERDRRELLANTYLRRGFPAAAAEEWFAVCGEQPDFKALLGLAKVAEQQGMLTEAIDFAQGALEHDPGEPTASALLARALARHDAPAEGACVEAGEHAHTDAGADAAAFGGRQREAA